MFDFALLMMQMSWINVTKKAMAARNVAYLLMLQFFEQKLTCLTQNKKKSFEDVFKKRFVQGVKCVFKRIEYFAF